MPTPSKGIAKTRSRSGGIPVQLMTKELHKALKQFERIDPKDPRVGVKRGTAIRKMMDIVVEKAVDGDMQAIQFCVERIEGKAKQVTENTGNVNHNLAGLTISFEKPLDITPQTELIENGSD